MEPVVTIAIPDVAGTVARTATIQALARNTPEPYEIVLLTERLQPAPVTPKQIDQALRQITVPAPFSTPVALNRLLATCTTPYILLLESGAIVTPGWLSKLLAPLNDPAAGLSGPSTNSSWNEQKILAGSEGMRWSAKQIDAFAANVAQHYKNQWRSLDTLHSLGDFCYLFKRSVAEQLGGFDEAYGAGPCWEIDFNTRAARAGFRALWAADAYVHRASPFPWKVNSVQHLFPASKQLYQDRFCGLRLQGQKTDYEPHCRGEACEHFAPPALIRVKLAHTQAEQPPRISSIVLPIQNTPPNEITASEKPVERASAPQHTPLHPLTAASINLSGDTLPLVSCIMPTCNRRAFVQQALTYFDRQDYPNKELIIVDDGEDKVADLVSTHPHVRYIALTNKMSIGSKRNVGCELAKGAIIAQWDDDDWYAPHRISYQVAPLLAGKADLTGLETFCFFDLQQWQAWTCTPNLHRRLFVRDVHGGTLVYWRRVWEHLGRYPDASLAEDAQFLQQACRRGARVQKLPHDHAFVYLRHSSNAWRFPLGTYLGPAGWRQLDPNACMPAGDLSFYRAISHEEPAPTPQTSDQANLNRGEAAHPIVTITGDTRPLVSCIMPTYNRREYVPQAIHYFLRQDYPNSELIILDDGAERVDDLVPPDTRIRYIRLDRRVILGAKRNLACKLAKGSIIVHWDDDDWMAPYRLSYQVEVLQSQAADLCGTYRQVYYDPTSDKAWLYEYPYASKRVPVGSTLCYRKSLWARNPFPDVTVGEDNLFARNSRARKIAFVPDHSFYIGLIHPNNTSKKILAGSCWQPHPVEEVHALLGPDLGFYQEA